MIFAILLRPQMRLGRLEDAKTSHQRGETLSSDKAWPSSVWRLSEHLVYLQHIGDIAQATKLARKYLPVATETADVENRMKFYFPAACLLDKLSQRRTKLLPPQPAEKLPRLSGEQQLSAGISCGLVAIASS